MSIFSPQSTSASTAVPDLMMAPDQAPSLSPSERSALLARLIDERRALAAMVAGKDLEIATALGDQYQQDLQTLDRIEAQRECFFDVMGEVRMGCLPESG